MTHDYKRNGTTTLFAAMSKLDGQVIGECMPRPSVEELEHTITAAIEQPNKAPRPYIWTTEAKDILAKVIRARPASNDPRFSGTPP